MDSTAINNSKKHTVKKKHQFTLLDEHSGSIPSGNITYIIAFVLPLVMMIALYYTRKIFPFGEECYLRSDMYHQYAPFFSELWNKIRNGESLTYSWNIGMGVNFTSLYAYYLASPSNWFIALFPQKNMIEIMNSLIILKISLASLSITYYITKHFKTKTCLAALFGVFYGMSGFIAAYSWNIMWLDCVILVPLIMLGLEYLVNKNKCFLYCISLGLCIYTNYYIAIMVCMSVVLYYVVLMIAYDGKKSPLIYLKKFLNFCLYSLLAGGLAACLLLPEMYTFSLSASSNTTFPQTLNSYFSILLMLTRQLIDVPIHMGLDHYPNIYCGVAIFLLIPLYIMSTKVNAREKIGKCVLLIIFLTAFNMNIPNYVWHGFHFPNSLPCRQSFIYIFFLLTMCFEGLKNLKHASNKQIGGALWIAIGFLLIVEQFFTQEGQFDFKVVYISGIFILLYALFMYIHNNSKLKVPVVLFLTFSCAIIECTMNMDSTGIGTTNRTSYLLDYDAVETVVDTVKADDKSFYRMDKIFGARSKNDGAWHNYKTISTFSSTCSGGMSKLYGLLGLENSTNAYGCNGLTAVTRMLFAEKYSISNKLLTESEIRTFYSGSDGEFIYKNEYTLPLGFCINSETAARPDMVEGNNGIENQNAFIASLTGVTDIFTVNSEFSAATECNINPLSDGHMYIVVRNTANDNINVNVSGKDYSFSNMKNNNRIIDVGYVTTTDLVRVTAENSMNLVAYMMDTDKFIEAYDILNEGAYAISKYSDTKFVGTVNANENCAMLFSIPFDKGWSVYVDGKKVETTAFKNALLCIEDLPAGTHKIELRYRPVNLIKGIIITVISILILVALFYAGKLRSKSLKHKKTEDFEDEDLYEDEILDSMNDFDSLDMEESDNNDNDIDNDIDINIDNENNTEDEQ